MTFDSIQDLKAAFVNGIMLEDTFTIRDGFAAYRKIEQPPTTFDDVLYGRQKGTAVYVSEDNKVLVPLWGVDLRANIIPFDVYETTAEEYGLSLEEADQPNNERVIGDQTKVTFLNFTSKPDIYAKIDTGADLCSLHCSKWRLDEATKSVTFIAPDLSQNQLTMQVSKTIPIKSSDGGVEYRPVVELDVEVNGKSYTGVEFNLNDRSKMEFKVLIGQNLLEKGKFLIDPSINEAEASFNWNKLQEDVAKIPTKVDNDELLDALAEMMLRTNVTFADVAERIQRKQTDSE